MRRTHIIEYGIVIIGLIFGFKFFESIFSAIVQIFYGLQGSMRSLQSLLLPTLFVILVYGVSFVLLIRKSGQIATLLNRDNENELISVKIGQKNLLHVVLIGICVTSLIYSIPTLLSLAYDYFKHEAGRRNLDDYGMGFSQGEKFKSEAIQTIVTLVILFFSRDISGWFISKDEVDELTFDSTPEN
jgi:hypothetical protein